MINKRIKTYQEINYIISIIIMSFATAMVASADFGVSSIVAIPYLLSLKFNSISFGIGSYIFQGFLLVLMCILVKKVKLLYFFSFITVLLFGACLDFWRLIIPLFSPDLVGKLDIVTRIILFLLALPLLAFSVELAFRSYIFPQIDDFFVIIVGKYFNFKLSKFKLFYDVTFLILSVVLSFVMFSSLKGIGIGTFVIAFTNGPLISLFDKYYSKYCTNEIKFLKLQKYFDLSNIESKHKKSIFKEETLENKDLKQIEEDKKIK